MENQLEFESVKNNLERIRSQILDCEKSSNRPLGSVKLVAVSKFHPAESVLFAMDAGQNLFGENRVQEAAKKFDFVREQGRSPELHIIGQLQRNKVKEAVRIASCIESVDRLELLQEIEKQCAKIEKTIQIFFEIHTGEESKSGFESAESLYEVLKKCADGEFPHVNPTGLMTMAPNSDDKELVRKSFSTLKNLRDKIRLDFPSLNINELSMGMSGDFPIAIEEGATIVRVGTAIFGQRNYDA